MPRRKKHAQHAITYEVYYTSYERDMVGAVRERRECTPIRDPVRSVQGYVEMGDPPYTYSGPEDSLSRLAGRRSLSADARRYKRHVGEAAKEVEGVN